MSTHDEEFARLVRSLRDDPQPQAQAPQKAAPAVSAAAKGAKAGRSLATVVTNRAMVPMAAVATVVVLSGAFLGYQHYATEQAAEQARSAQIDLERQRLEIEAAKHEIEAGKIARAEQVKDEERAEKARSECFKAARGMSDWTKTDFLQTCTANIAPNGAGETTGMQNTSASGGSGMPSGASLLGGFALVGAGWFAVSRIKAKRHPA
ncbi:hypothetical protein [Streptomyces microflavus]|uniref:hypothetical protein n=1 Tax=Streptomyces microflavus TaxID=1919 RepID=UPI003655E03A